MSETPLDSPRADQEYRRQANVPHRWWILCVVGLAQLMVTLDATVVNIALPAAQADLGFSNGDRQWVVTAYSLAFGSLLLLGGRLSDLFGRRVTFQIGLIGFAVASALGGAAPDFPTLVAARALQGVFAAFLAPTALSVLTTTFTDPKDRGKAFGIYGGISGAGGAVGLLLGGVLTEHLSWRWSLYINIVFTVAAIIGVALTIPRQKRAARPALDTVGTLLVCSAFFSLVFGFSKAETNGWSSPASWGFLAAGGVLLPLFTLRQRRTPSPLLPLEVVLDRHRAAAFLTVLISGAGMFGVFLFLTYYLQVSLHYTPVRTGLAFLPLIVSIVVTAALANTVLVPRWGPKAVVPVGMLLVASGMSYLTRLDLNSTYATDVLPAMLIIGVGVGAAMAPSVATATLGVNPLHAGVASATANTSQQIGGSIGTALLNTLAGTAAADYVAHHRPVTKDVLAQAALHSYSTAYWWSAALFVFGALLSALMYRTRADVGARAASAPAVGQSAMA